MPATQHYSSARKMFDWVQDFTSWRLLAVFVHRRSLWPAGSRALGDLGVAATELARHIAWDIGIAGRRRAACEAARRPSDRAALLAAGDRLQPPAAMRRVRSRRISEATGDPGQRRPERERRPRRGARRSSDPYHDRIDGRDRRRRAGRSADARWWRCTASRRAIPDVARPWHVGTLYQRDTRLPPLLLEPLYARKATLVVGDNEPYAAEVTRPITPSLCTAKRAG